MQSKYPSLFWTISKLMQGQSLARIFLNHETKFHSIRGNVLDVGSGRTVDYHHLVQEKGTDVRGIDKKIEGDGSVVDFEQSTLPYQDGMFDGVLMFNVLEHIYNHAHLLREVRRILKTEGIFYGFVPFLVQYHPDPHDYFRYTKEALCRLLNDSGFERVEVKCVGGGGILAAYNLISHLIPRFLHIITYPPMFVLDYIYVRIRPETRERYPLGYFWVAQA